MKRKRFTEEQIVAILKEAAASDNAWGGASASTASRIPRSIGSRLVAARLPRRACARRRQQPSRHAPRDHGAQPTPVCRARPRREGVRVSGATRVHPAREASREPLRRELSRHTSTECLDQHWLSDLRDARDIVTGLQEDYNTVRPHSSLQQLTPGAYARTFTRLLAYTS